MIPSMILYVWYIATNVIMEKPNMSWIMPWPWDSYDPVKYGKPRDQFVVKVFYGGLDHAAYQSTNQVI